MLDVRIFFDDELVGHFHTADFSNATDVIASEVNQHHVFCDLFRICQQFIGQLGVELGRRTTRAGAGQWANRYFALAVAVGFVAHQNFG